jgi:PIN domain nuclease of toxin-antitoxin system
VWIYAGHWDRIPAAARRRLDDERLAISPMVELELEYLFEIGRTSTPARHVLDELVTTLELQVSTAPFTAVVKEAANLRWTRDPFDRLIASQALADRTHLLTADRHILANLPAAVWGTWPS